MSSLHSRPSRCKRTSCRSFALLLYKLLVQLLLHEILNRKLESNLSDIVLVLGCSTGIIPSTIGMRVISALRGNRSGVSVIPLTDHLRILYVYAQPSWLRVRVSLPFDIAGRFWNIHSSSHSCAAASMSASSPDDELSEALRSATEAGRPHRPRPVDANRPRPSRPRCCLEACRFFCLFQ